MTLSAITSVAIRVHKLDEMTSFYHEAFGISFHEVETFGVTSRFGEFNGVTIKLVPIRKEVDFENFPELQLGFQVQDVSVVITCAIAHGGRQEGRILRENGRIHASVRDPDGNTIELYQDCSSL